MATQDTGSHAAGERRGGGLLWLWLLLGALALALAIWAVVELLDGDDEVDEALPVTSEEPSVETTEDDVDVETVEPTVTVDATTTSTATATATETETETAAPAPAPAPGPIVIGDVDVLAAAPADLAPLVGEQVTAESVQVVELVADEAFYVGPEVGSTILVRLQEFAGPGEAESPFQVEEGGTVSITGTLQQIDEGLTSSLQLYDPAEALELGEYYIQADEITGVG